MTSSAKEWRYEAQWDIPWLWCGCELGPEVVRCPGSGYTLLWARTNPAQYQHQHLDINIPALRRGDADTAPPPTAHINLVQLHYKPQQPSTQQSNVQLKHLAAV